MKGTYKIQEGSQVILGTVQDGKKEILGKKTGMTVTFSADDNEVTCYHEIESTDEKVIATQLQLAADEYASRFEEKPLDVAMPMEGGV